MSVTASSERSPGHAFFSSRDRPAISQAAEVGNARQDVALFLDLYRQWNQQIDRAVERHAEERGEFHLGTGSSKMASPSLPGKPAMRKRESVTLRSGSLSTRSKSNTGLNVPVPVTAPQVKVLTPGGCQHVILFEPAEPKGRRPTGSSGAEIYIAVGRQRPETMEAFRFAAWATRSPHTLSFAPQDAGRTAHYALRWINAKGENGPWSEIVSAVIPQAIEVA